MALREEALGTEGTRLHDVLDWAGVTGVEIAPVLGVSNATVTRLKEKGEGIEIGVVKKVAQYCAGKGVLSHIEDWRVLRSFILDGGELEGPKFLYPSMAPKADGGQVVDFPGGTGGNFYFHQRAS